MHLKITTALAIGLRQFFPDLPILDDSHPSEARSFLQTVSPSHVLALATSKCVNLLPTNTLNYSVIFPSLRLTCLWMPPYLENLYPHQRWRRNPWNASWPARRCGRSARSWTRRWRPCGGSTRRSGPVTAARSPAIWAGARARSRDASSTWPIGWSSGCPARTCNIIPLFTFLLSYFWLSLLQTFPVYSHFWGGIILSTFYTFCNPIQDMSPFYTYWHPTSDIMWYHIVTFSCILIFHCDIILSTLHAFRHSHFPLILCNIILSLFHTFWHHVISYYHP